jgi:hypothetical protein
LPLEMFSDAARMPVHAVGRSAHLESRVFRDGEDRPAQGDHSSTPERARPAA